MHSNFGPQPFDWWVTQLKLATIERCGGYVESSRVNGDLALSRAFGDADFKRSLVQGRQLGVPKTRGPQNQCFLFGELGGLQKSLGLMLLLLYVLTT